jgi:hypothetical protein
VPGGDGSEGSVRPGERTLGQGPPREVREPFARAVADDLLLDAASGEVVLVLHRDDRNDLADSICSIVAFERPTCRIFPSARSSASAPIESSSGTAESKPCS